MPAGATGATDLLAPHVPIRDQGPDETLRHPAGSASENGPAQAVICRPTAPKMAASPRRLVFTVLCTMLPKVGVDAASTGFEINRGRSPQFLRINCAQTALARPPLFLTEP